MECLSLKEVYQECLQLEQGDRRKAVEGALSLWSMGTFDAMESIPRERLINETLAKVTKER